MRLLSVIHYPVFGGPHNQALRLTGPLQARGVDTVVALPAEVGNAADRLRGGDVRVVAMTLHRLRASRDPALQLRLVRKFRSEVAQLRGLIRQEGIDVVQVNGLINPHAAIAARLEGKAVVWQLLDTRAPMAARRAFMPMVRSLSDVVMTTGMRTARAHPGAVGMGSRLVPFVPPVDTSRFMPSDDLRSQARERLGIAARTLLIGAVANLNPQKGHEHLLEAVALLQRDGLDVDIRILGARTPTQEAYAQLLERRVVGLRLANDPAEVLVDPGGYVERWLPAFDVFALAALPRSEGIPTAMLEAMSCGVPAVMSDVGGVRDALEDGVNGYVVRPLNARVMASAIARLLKDDKLRAHYGADARRSAVKRFDVSRCADVHLQAYTLAVKHRQ